MKFAVALGGFAGFTLCALVGLVAGRDLANVLFEACLAAVIGAVLFRWLHLSFVRSVQASFQARREARATDSEKAQPSKT
jgi:putative Ca2+/H+ antiporter (TMEM165/GDT1 family)